MGYDGLWDGDDGIYDFFEEVLEFFLCFWYGFWGEVDVFFGDF